MSDTVWNNTWSALKHFNNWSLIHHTVDIKILVFKCILKPNNTVLTLTFKVQLLNEELRSTSSWILVSGLSTTDLQETQWKFWLRKRKQNKVMICHDFCLHEYEAISIKLTVFQLASLNCHFHSGCRQARNKPCSHPHQLSSLQSEIKVLKCN